MLQYYFSLRQFRLTKWSFFIHSTTPYIHLRLNLIDILEFGLRIEGSCCSPSALSVSSSLMLLSSLLSLHSDQHIQTLRLVQIVRDHIHFKSEGIRAVSHIHRIRTETVTATELHRFVCGRPFTYEPNPWTKSKKMPAYFGLISLSDSRNTFKIQIVLCHCIKFVVFIVALGIVPQKSVVNSIVLVK